MVITPPATATISPCTVEVQMLSFAPAPVTSKDESSAVRFFVDNYVWLIAALTGVVLGLIATGTIIVWRLYNRPPP